jgi:hypothetical protein
VLRLRHRFLINLNLCDTDATHRGVKPRKAKKKARPKLRLVSSASRARMTEGVWAVSLGALGIGSPADGANFRELPLQHHLALSCTATSISVPFAPFWASL